MTTRKIPKKYIPSSLSSKDKKKIKREIEKSRKLYKKGKYHKRKHAKTFKSKVSPHIKRARKIYKLENITPNKSLSKKSGCSLKTLKDIKSRGMGAYYSSGSRPNQSAQSWGLARLASSITGGKASKSDFDLIKCGCNKNKPAYKLAIKPDKN